MIVGYPCHTRREVRMKHTDYGAANSYGGAVTSYDEWGVRALFLATPS